MDPVGSTASTSASTSTTTSPTLQPPLHQQQQFKRLSISAINHDQKVTKLACVMVGLPARGKTYISRKLARYLAWLGHRTRIFNVGNYRREALGVHHRHEFFDPDNKEASQSRSQVAAQCLNDMLSWFETAEREKDPNVTVSKEHHAVSVDNLSHSLHTTSFLSSNNTTSATTIPIDSIQMQMTSPSRKSTLNQSGENAITGPTIQGLKVNAAHAHDTSIFSPASVRNMGTGVSSTSIVAVFDATNSTIDRREMLFLECEKRGIGVIFIESICDDEEIIMQNIREVKLSSPDYVGFDPDQAISDFIARIKHYERAYQTIDPSEINGRISFVKLVNVGDQVIVNKVRGYLQSRIVYFLMNINITPRSIYFCRHGESIFNVQGRIGGDARLSLYGLKFAKLLPDFFKQELKDDTKLTIWTSTLKRTIETALELPYQKLHWKQLDELDSGLCNGLTYEEIEKEFPLDFRARDEDKFNFRYQRGESYRDLVHRLEPVIMELERHHEANHSILIIGHQAVLRAIYAYYLNYSHEELPYVKIPLHEVVKLTPKAYGCVEETFHIPVPATDTHRDRPSPMSSYP